MLPDRLTDEQMNKQTNGQFVIVELLLRLIKNIKTLNKELNLKNIEKNSWLNLCILLCILGFCKSSVNTGPLGQAVNVPMSFCIY